MKFRTTISALALSVALFGGVGATFTPALAEGGTISGGFDVGPAVSRATSIRLRRPAASRGLSPTTSRWLSMTKSSLTSLVRWPSPMM